jgi:hypothetical protein
MFLFFGLDRKRTKCIAMATSLLEFVDREATLKGEWRDLISGDFESVVAVSNANCVQGLPLLLRFLAKTAKNQDIETSSKEMMLMADFAKPKQGLVGKKPA